MMLPHMRDGGFVAITNKFNPASDVPLFV